MRTFALPLPFLLSFLSFLLPLVWAPASASADDGFDAYGRSERRDAEATRSGARGNPSSARTANPQDRREGTAAGRGRSTEEDDGDDDRKERSSGGRRGRGGSGGDD